MEFKEMNEDRSKRILNINSSHFQILSLLAHSLILVTNLR